MMDRRLVFLVVSLLSLIFAYVFVRGVGGSGSASVVASIDPDVASPGDYVTLSATLSDLSWTSPGYYCVDYSSIQSATWCNSSSGQCYTPCQHPSVYGSVTGADGYQVWLCAENSGSAGCTLALYSGAKPSIRESTNPTYVGAVDYLLSNSSQSAFTGFPSAVGQRLKVSFTISSYTSASFSLVKPTVALCYTGQVGYTPPSSMTYYTTVSGYWYGADWTCVVYTSTDSITSLSDYWLVTSLSSDARWYLSFATQCWYDSSQCTSTAYGVDVSVDAVMPDPSNIGSSLFYFVDDPNVVTSCAYVQGTSDSSTGSTYTYTNYFCQVYDVSPDTYTFSFDFYDYGVVWYHAFSGSVNYVSGAGEFLGADTVTLTVTNKATNVNLYAYGSTTGTPYQPANDTTVKYRVYVSGGTLFDSVYVRVTHNGSEVASHLYYPSDMTCSVSGQYCYVDVSDSLYGNGDGTVEIDATLSVDGAAVDSAVATLSYYDLGADMVSAQQSSVNQLYVDLNFGVKGGWSSYTVYIDSPSCVVTGPTSNTSSSPSTWQYTSGSYQIPDCALSSGTHDVCIRASDSSGHTVSDCVSTVFNFSFEYSITATAPIAGTVYDVNTTSPGTVPSTFSITSSASYSTDDPRGADVNLFVNNVSVYGTSVSSGSGTLSYTVSASNLVCGTDTFDWRIYDVEGALKDTDSTYATVYCWYTDIQPSGTVKVPSADLVTPLPSASIDVYIDADVTPAKTYSVRFLFEDVDLSDLLSTDCPSPYEYCASVTPADYNYVCGGSYTITSELYDGASLRASDSSTITVQCVQNYVIIREPVDGAVYDLLDTTTIPPDFNVVVGVEYSDVNLTSPSLSTVVNGQEVSLPTVTPCDYNVCYEVNSTYLQSGDNNVWVGLYDGATLIDSDDVVFSVYPWYFEFLEYSFTGFKLLAVHEYASHAQTCDITIDGNTSSMYYDSQASEWQYIVYPEDAGKEFNISCYSPSGAVVYTYSGVVSFAPSGGAPAGGGGGVAPPSQPAPEEVCPVWPTVGSVDSIRWTIVDGDLFKEVCDGCAANESYVCLSPSDAIEAVIYYPLDINGIPSDRVVLQRYLDSLVAVRPVDVNLVTVGNLACAPLSGSGVYAFQTSSGPIRVMVYVPSGFAVPWLPVVLAVILVVGVVLYLYYRGMI